MVHWCYAQGLDAAKLSTLSSPEQMTSVLAPYSPSNSIFMEKYAPERRISGFVSSPTSYAGRNTVEPTTVAFKQSMKFEAPSPNSSPTSTMMKFAFDQSAALPHIPVASRKMLFANA